MNVFLQPLSELEELQNALKQLKSNQGIVQISGCMDAQKAHMVFAANDGFRNKIIVTFNEQKAREIKMLSDYIIAYSLEDKSAVTPEQNWEHSNTGF